MAALELDLFLCRTDNYGVLLHDRLSGATASIDAPEERPILDALERRGWQLTHILTRITTVICGCECQSEGTLRPHHHRPEERGVEDPRHRQDRRTW